MLDENMLHELRQLVPEGADPEAFVAKILGIYLDHAPVVVAALAAAAEKVDMELIRHHSHKLKGMADNIGATTFSELCGRLEKMAHTSQVEAVDFTTQVQSASLDVIIEVKRRLGQL